MQYQRLELERQFAEKRLAAALTSFQEAQSEARRKQAYVERIVEPNVPDEAAEPRRLRGILATFVLVSQNRMTEVADKRADLDLQINLLSEYEITRVLTLVDAIAEHLGLEVGQDPEVEELKNDVNPDQVLDEMERRKKDLQAAGGTTKV